VGTRNAVLLLATAVVCLCAGCVHDEEGYWRREGQMGMSPAFGPHDPDVFQGVPISPPPSQKLPSSFGKFK